jgi:hypothetical protein
MKKFLFAAVLALPVLALAIEDASAGWNICGQKSCSYSFNSPRFWFGFDCGCPQGCAAPAAPYAAPAGPALPGKPEAAVVAPMTTQPASYQVPAAGYYAPAQANYAVPSYWYGR